MNDLAYLELLSRQFPTIQSAATEIISLEAGLSLPKETEHFLSDLHGEYEPFLHLLKSGSGSLRRRIDELFGDELSPEDRRTLAALIYYPQQKLPLILQEVEDAPAWYRATLPLMVRLCRSLSSKYTRTYVRSLLPAAFAAIIEELLALQLSVDRTIYYENLIESITSVDQGFDLTVAFAELLQRLAIGHLHIIGDVFDRGPGAHIIMDELLGYHSVDMQWGNHDIVWMGAAAGSPACIANVVRLSLRYNNMETLENGYGINLIPLASFAMDVYGDDPCLQFLPRLEDDPMHIDRLDESELQLLARMQKAISIIQFKLEGQIIRRRPHFDMDERLLLDKIDPVRSVVRVGDKDFELLDHNFPTLDSENPYVLTAREEQLMNRLALAFQSSAPLQRHIRFLYSKGGMYRVYNNNLLYHGCISLNTDGTFSTTVIDGQPYSGKSYMDRVDRLARKGYFAADPSERLHGQDVLWYLWSGARSPLYGKDKMATFERYFLSDESTHKERQNPYYSFRDDEVVVRRILVEFGVDPEAGCIVNGHVPVRVARGQSPVKAAGKLIIIDGGLAKAYQKVTGIAGYTLIANSHGVLLAQHKPFESAQKAILEDVDMESSTTSIHTYPGRVYVKDTDHGAAISQRIAALKDLLGAYRAGLIKEI